MEKKTRKKELQLIRSTINSVTGLEDEDEDLLQYAYEAVSKLIKSLADQPANQLDDIDVVDIPAQQQVPLAYAVFHRNGGGKSLHWPEQHSTDGDGKQYRLVPLYPPSPASKPLTKDKTMKLANKTAGQYWMDEAHIQRFRSAVEAEHGIKENT